MPAAGAVAPPMLVVVAVALPLPAVGVVTPPLPAAGAVTPPMQAERVVAPPTRAVGVVAPPMPGTGAVAPPMPAAGAVAPPMLVVVARAVAPQLWQVVLFSFVVLPSPAACGLMTWIVEKARQPSAVTWPSPLVTLLELMVYLPSFPLLYLMPQVQPFLPCEEAPCRDRHETARETGAVEARVVGAGGYACGELAGWTP